MKQAAIAIGVVILGVTMALGGYIFGFFKGMAVGALGEMSSRGSLATYQIDALQNGRTDRVITLLEHDIDHGLLMSDLLLGHSHRTLFKPVWGSDEVSRAEETARQLANYRKEHPSPFWKTPVQPGSAITQSDVNEMRKRIDDAVAKHATKK